MAPADDQLAECHAVVGSDVGNGPGSLMAYLGAIACRWLPGCTEPAVVYLQRRLTGETPACSGCWKLAILNGGTLGHIP